jgi:UTP--glucose-1-phosphate uridylyltransferase
MWSIHAGTSASVLCVRDVRGHEINRFGVAECVAENGRLRVVGLVEKPAPSAVASRLAVFGRYIVTEPVLEALSELSSASDVELQLTDGFAAVLGREPAVFALKFADDFYDCGTPEAYARSVARYMRRTGESRRRC